MSARSLISAALLVLLSNGLAGCDTSDPGSVDGETLAMIDAGETAAWVFRAVAAAVSDPLDWNTTETDLQQQALDRIVTTYSRRCIQVGQRDDRSVTLTFDACSLLERLIQGSIHFVVDADFVAADPSLRIDVDLPQLSFNKGEFRGYGTLSNRRSAPDRFDGDMHIRFRGESSFDFEGNGHFAALRLAEQHPCVEVNALGFVQTDTASVAMSFHEALYCSGRCGESGAVVGAGRFLQRLRFAERAASRSVADGPEQLVPLCARRAVGDRRGATAQR